MCASGLQYHVVSQAATVVVDERSASIYMSSQWNEASAFVQNVGIHLPVYVVLRSARL